MSGNTFGTLFKVTTWGESHGLALGAVVDGCPPGIPLDNTDIQKELNKRKPFKSKISTSRIEQDKVEILSGVFKGKTTGMPISMIVFNKNFRSKDYSNLKDIYRPGHADYTIEKKYGIRDYRGGGRLSGRETVSRVMAGAIAKIILNKKKIKIVGHTIQIGPHKAVKFSEKEIEGNEIKCGDNKTAIKMIEYIEKIRNEGDSIGGIVQIIIKNVEAGLGEPVFNKLDATLSHAIMSIGTVKGISFGSGFDVSNLKGSENNDQFDFNKGNISTLTNHCGGILGGISNGEDIIINIAVKPPSSISKKQHTIDKKGEKVSIKIEGQHDACIIPRFIPVAENMTAITLVDHLLQQNSIK